MKTAERVDEAVRTVASDLLKPDLTDLQRAILCGMLNALTWVADGDSDERISCPQKLNKEIQ